MEELRRGEPERAEAVSVIVEPDMSALADSRLLRVVLENLLGKAWKFTSKTDAPRIELRTSTLEGQKVFQIVDNGAGFDMAYARKLFQPFQRLHGESEFSGTGIGLATVRRVLERHGGKIWAEGATGQGATLSFTIPPSRTK